MIDAINDFLANRALRTVLFKTRYLLALAALVPVARFMNPAWLPAAFAVSLVGQLIQTWCFASLVKNRELTMRGPYLLVRNPMYLGRYLLILGFVLLLASPAAVAVYTVLYVVYMVARVKREEKRLRRKFGEQYERYCRDVNRFLPSPRRIGDRDVWFFSSEMFFENNAHWNIVLTLAAYGAVYGLWLGLTRGGWA